VKLVVGSLTRLFGGDDPAARERIARGVRRWREDLNEALRPHLRTALDWNEDQEESWSAALEDTTYRALMLLAAHAQKTDYPWPDEVPPRVDTDPAWQEISADDFARCHYPQVVIPRLWVPGDFALTMKHALPDGEEVVLGSLDGLRTQLHQLNKNTLQLGRTTSIDPDATGREFVDHAACGLSVFTTAAEKGSELGTPIALA
jgi:hypothetical protein